MGKQRSSSTGLSDRRDTVEDPTDAGQPATGAAEALLTSAQVARYLGISEATLSRWRHQAIGPNWIDLAGIARYRPKDLEAHLRAMRR